MRKVSQETVNPIDKAGNKEKRKKDKEAEEEDEPQRPTRKQRRRKQKCILVRVVCWLLNVPATCYCTVFQGRICSDKFTCYHTKIEVADHTFHLKQSQSTDAGPTSPSADPITPGAVQVTTGAPISKSLI